MKIGYDCGHAVNLVTPSQIPPPNEPYTLYPLIEEHPVEIGDVMTCVICDQVRTITKIYADVELFMPQFQIQTPDGYNYQIHSSDRETIGRWFAEMAGRFASDTVTQADYHLRIWPIFLPDPKTGKSRPDWCANSTHWWCHEAAFDGTMQSLVSVLTETIEKEPER